MADIFTLKDLQENVNDVVSHLQGEKPEDIQVVISLKEPSIGTSAASPLSMAYKGFDWDSGRYILYAKDELIREHVSRDKVIPAVLRKYETDLYFCQKCNCIVDEKDYFCKHCGQKMREK